MSVGLQARESPFAAHARKFTPGSTQLSPLRTHSLPMLSHDSSALKPLSTTQLAAFSQRKPSSYESASYDDSEGRQRWSLEAVPNSARASDGTTIIDAGSQAGSADSSSKPLGYYPAKSDHDADANGRSQTVPEELSSGNMLLPASTKQTSPAKETPERAKSPPRAPQVFAHAAKPYALVTLAAIAVVMCQTKGWAATSPCISNVWIQHTQ